MHGGFAAEFDAAFFVHADAFDGNDVADFDDVFHYVDAEVRELADVDEALHPGLEFHEIAVHNPDFFGKTLAELMAALPAGVQIIPLVCFEDTFGRLARKFVRDAPQLLVNCTNDGWFLHSAENEQHLASARFRCIELRRPMVRAANTGVTCAIDADGRILPENRLANARTDFDYLAGEIFERFVDWALEEARAPAETAS